MGHSQREREAATAASEADARRLRSAARAALREAERERGRARKLAARFARKLHHTLTAARAQLDSDRAAINAKIAKFNSVQSEFHAASRAERHQLHESWKQLESRQIRLTEEWSEVHRAQAEQTAALEARAAALDAREQADAETRNRLHRDIAVLRDEAAALDARARNARLVVAELEQQRTALRAAALAPAISGEELEMPQQLRIALDRSADRDLGAWAAELEQTEERLKQERGAIQSLFKEVAAEQADIADRRRLLAEQFTQLAAARAQWQEAEWTTVAEMEQLARTLQAREAELDARQQRLVHADSRRREDAYDLWQLRMRLEAWQSKIVAYEMRWHSEQEAMEADYARRERELLERAAIPVQDDDLIPLAHPAPDFETPALPAELTTLREELDRMAAVLLEAELPEPMDPPESELPWGTDVAAPPHVAENSIHLLSFESSVRAA